MNKHLCGSQIYFKIHQKKLFKISIKKKKLGKAETPKEKNFQNQVRPHFMNHQWT